MPLVRISHAAGKTTAFAEALSKGVHDAMVETFNVPKDDVFQVLTDHGAGLRVTPSFLGIDHGPEPVFIQITCSEGRSVDQKKALFAGIASRLAAEPGVPADDIIINLVETKRENWSFGRGLAQYA
ncbi:MAG: tautomerase family protein [Methylocystis sp.]|jgi:4-oxalocrotonate tautomerase|nr:tautomerase family protein [Methylocystis sp.]MCA3582649.1 tautomerase family protein [Methylocystis sp.]MCA3588652.1 tautomerase family protein [Methylocystis sp.]MCA3591678.1 tautomerase family protein [Methylocystis sp.]